jgi:hypothetical protein
VAKDTYTALETQVQDILRKSIAEVRKEKQEDRGNQKASVNSFEDESMEKSRLFMG